MLFSELYPVPGLGGLVKSMVFSFVFSSTETELQGRTVRLQGRGDCRGKGNYFFVVVFFLISKELIYFVYCHILTTFSTRGQKLERRVSSSKETNFSSI